MGYFKINAVVPDNIMSNGQQVDRIYSKGTLVWEKEPESYIIMTTDSESDAWSPSSVTNSGATLHWEVTGAATYSVDTNLPVFDFSTPGEKVITITSSDDLTGLQTLYLNNNQLTSFDATGLTGLQVLSLVGNQLTSFDATGLTGLRNLYLDNNQLTSFNATGLTGLKDIGLNINQLTTFDATGLIGLENLYLDKNPLTTFDATGLIVLKILYLQYTQLTTTSINNLLDQLLAIGNTSGSYLSLYGQTDGGCGDPAKIAALDAIWGTVYVDACSLPPTYPEVTIGNQTWMSVNLDIDDGGDGIYAYDNNEANVATYGRLYTWDAVVRVAANIDGWHLPSNAEWTTLTDYLGGTSVAGGKLKETGTTHWKSPNIGATNETGFTALPGGYRYSDGSFYNFGSYGYWWSATEADATTARYCYMHYNFSDIAGFIGKVSKGYGYSVRLIKDYSHTPNITLVGDNPVTISVGDTYTDAGATAYDTRYGDITSDIVVVNNVNTSVAGTYTVTYNITTEDGYSAEEVVRTVVVEDNTIPVITVHGTDPVTITQGDVYVDAGATALDNYDGDITDNIITYNPVNVNVIGSYNITYNVQDSSGNNAIEKGRVVNVISAGPVFPEVTIGTQTWMAVNLDIDDGLGGIYAYNNDEANVATYGRLYTWDAAVRVANSIDGWHLPSDAEWTTLTTYLGGESVAGGKLKEAGTTHWKSPNTGATNESGFTALPGGYRLPNGTFGGIGNYGGWWSATELNSGYAWYRTMDYSASNVNRYNSLSKEFGFSVRLIRD